MLLIAGLMVWITSRLLPGLPVEWLQAQRVGRVQRPYATYGTNKPNLDTRPDAAAPGRDGKTIVWANTLA